MGYLGYTHRIHLRILLQDMKISHRDAAQHCADDPQKTLVGATQVNVFQRCATLAVFDRCAVNSPSDMSREFGDGARREHVRRDRGFR